MANPLSYVSRRATYCLEKERCANTQAEADKVAEEFRKEGFAMVRITSFRTGPRNKNYRSYTVRAYSK